MRCYIEIRVELRKRRKTTRHMPIFKSNLANRIQLANNKKLMAKIGRVTGGLQEPLYTPSPKLGQCL